MKMLLGPHPLHRRWRIAIGALALSLALFGLASVIDPGPGLRPLTAMGLLALLVALHVWLFRIIHPAILRRTLPQPKTGNAFIRWYLDTGDQR
ncbi:hypothetical protein [Ponticoccus litoralis]|uniref:DUF4405 domain-containing protein n=1 Tax=Ponticoccus litoralis TaxID=422297 RepID=A0AAW9SGP8_9RHOB